jgi:hypothetical protein
VNLGIRLPGIAGLMTWISVMKIDSAARNGVQIPDSMDGDRRQDFA